MIALNIPNDEHTEQVILGTLLYEEVARSEYIPELKESDFYYKQHQIIFNVMHDLFIQKKHIDTLAVVRVLQSKELLNAIGGSTYLSDMSINLITREIQPHITALKNLSKARKIIEICNHAQQQITDGEPNVKNTIEWLSKNLMDISIESEDNEAVHAGYVANDVVEDLYKRMNGQENTNGVPTGISTLDEYIIHFQNQDLVLLAARPSMGKTTLMMNIADHIANVEQKNTLVFSLEMSKDSLMMRELSANAGVPLLGIRKGVVNQGQYEIISQKAIRTMEGKMFMYDKTCTVHDIRTIATRLKTKVGLDAIFIDYISKIKQTLKTENENSQISYISNELKTIAKDLNVPVICLVQLNRSVEHRQDKRPMMSDLRDSGSLEQDADIVLMLYRHGYYYPECENPNHTELLIRKNRNGAIGKVDLGFKNNITKFMEYDKYLKLEGNKKSQLLKITKY